MEKKKTQIFDNESINEQIKKMNTAQKVNLNDVKESLSEHVKRQKEEIEIARIQERPDPFDPVWAANVKPPSYSDNQIKKPSPSYYQNQLKSYYDYNAGKYVKTELTEPSKPSEGILEKIKDMMGSGVEFKYADIPVPAHAYPKTPKESYTIYDFNEDIVSKPSVVDDTEYAFRCLLSPDNRTCHTIKYPKDFKLGDEELLNLALSGTNLKVRLVEPLSKTRSKKTYLDLDALRDQIIRERGIPPLRRVRVTINPAISKDDFELKFNNLFTKTISFDEYVNQRSYSRSALIDSIRRNRCLKDTVLHLNDNGIGIFGITTGNYSTEKNSVEVITINKLSGGQYSENSTYKLSYFNIDAPIKSLDTSHNSKFIRFKLKSVNESVKLFGQPTAKKRLVGKILLGEKVKLSRKMIAGKDESILCLDYYTGDKFYTFTPNDVEILTIDPNLLPKTELKSNKNVKIGSEVRIVDDRKLSKFKKGDTAIVANLSACRTNMKNSLVVITKGSLKETVLLKQIKSHDKNNQKKEINFSGENPNVEKQSSESLPF